jgi:hypothetical protein
MRSIGSIDKEESLDKEAIDVYIGSLIARGKEIQIRKDAGTTRQPQRSSLES